MKELEGNGRGPGAERRELIGRGRGFVCLGALLLVSCGTSSLLTEPLHARHEADSPTGSMNTPPAPLPKPKREKSAESTPKDSPGEEESAVSVAKEVRLESPFHQVLEGTGSIVFQLGGAVWYGESHIFNLSTGEAIESCDYLSGVPLSGKSGWFASQLSPFSACPRSVWLTKATPKGMTRVRPLRLHDITSTLWKGSVTLAAEVPYRSGPPWGYRLSILEGGGLAPIVTAASPTALYSDEKPVPCYSALQRPRSLHGFESGELYVVGEGACGQGEDEDGLVSFEFWEANRRRSTFMSLPLHEFLGAAPLSPNEIYVLGRRAKDGDFSEGGMQRVLLRFDGKTWTELERGDAAPTQVFAMQGKLWGSLNQRLVRLTSGPAEEAARAEPAKDASLVLPEACSTAWQVWSEGGVVWLHCESGVFTTDKSQKPIVLPKELGECKTLQADPSKSRSSPAGNGKKPGASAPFGCGGIVRPSRTALPSGLKFSL